MHPEIQTAVLKTLGYFDHFKYPLRAEELLNFLEIKCEEDSLNLALTKLFAENKICRNEQFIALKNKESLFERRLKSNTLAKQLIPKAQRVGNLLYSFPFVRFVGISGSLSKEYADDKTDFDFFIVTAPNRLWIARSFMHAFKKLSFLVNKQSYFCMNYYLAEDRLNIEDVNRYTAIELSSMIPVVNQEVYLNLIRSNHWLNDLVPNFSPSKTAPYQVGFRPIKLLSENILNVFAPRKMNRFLLELTDTKWRKKWKKAGYPEEDYSLAFRTKEYVSKNHPKNYQKQVLEVVSKNALNLDNQ